MRKIKPKFKVGNTIFWTEHSGIYNGFRVVCRIDSIRDGYYYYSYLAHPNPESVFLRKGFALRCDSLESLAQKLINPNNIWKELNEKEEDDNETRKAKNRSVPGAGG